MSGLLQTVFICSYMLLAPIFGYLGDRFTRKWIIVFGVSLWSLMTFLGSFVPADVYLYFACHTYYYFTNIVFLFRNFGYF